MWFVTIKHIRRSEKVNLKEWKTATHILEVSDELHFQKNSNNKHQHGAEIQLPGEHHCLKFDINLILPIVMFWTLTDKTLVGEGIQIPLWALDDRLRDAVPNLWYDPHHQGTPTKFFPSLQKLNSLVCRKQTLWRRTWVQMAVSTWLTEGPSWTWTHPISSRRWWVSSSSCSGNETPKTSVPASSELRLGTKVLTQELRSMSTVYTGTSIWNPKPFLSLFCFLFWYLRCNHEF